MTPLHVTAAPWAGGLQHAKYGSMDTYRLAADWLKDCPTVADWGGGGGFFGTLLPAAVRYTVVDGTQQGDRQILADLVHYRDPSDGILLRHVLDINANWRAVLQNAIAAFRQRLVVITFTPAAAETGVVKVKSGWPVHQFRTEDLVQEMGPLLVEHIDVPTTHPERAYLLERR